MEQLVRCPSTCMSKRVKLPYGEVKTVVFTLFTQDSCMYAFVSDEVAKILVERHPRFTIISKNEYPIGIDVIRTGSATPEKNFTGPYSAYPSDTPFLEINSTSANNAILTLTPTHNPKRQNIIQRFLSFVGIIPHELRVIETTTTNINAGINVLTTRK